MTGKPEESPGRSAKACGSNLKWESFMAQKELWNTAKKRMREDRGSFPKEDGDYMCDNKITYIMFFCHESINILHNIIVALK